MLQERWLGPHPKLRSGAAKSLTELWLDELACIDCIPGPRIAEPLVRRCGNCSADARILVGVRRIAVPEEPEYGIAASHTTTREIRQKLAG